MTSWIFMNSRIFTANCGFEIFLDILSWHLSLTDTGTESYGHITGPVSCPGRELMLRIWQMHKAELHSSVTNLQLGRRRKRRKWQWLGYLEATWMIHGWYMNDTWMMDVRYARVSFFAHLKGKESGDTWRYMEIPYGSVILGGTSSQSELSSARPLSPRGVSIRPGDKTPVMERSTGTTWQRLLRHDVMDACGYKVFRRYSYHRT